MTKPVAWSFSVLNKFETCPYQYYKQRVTKEYKDEMSAAGLWGDRVHKALDKRIKDKAPLPEGMTEYEPYAARFDNAPGEVLSEQKAALTRNLEPTTWFAKDVWTRVILDILVYNGDKAIVFDWKTGKRKHDIDQLKLFAGTVMALRPQVQTVTTGYIWLKERKVDTDVFTRDDQAGIWQHFSPKVARFERAHEQQKWPKKPSGLCRKWCNVMDCEFNGRRDEDGAI